MILRKERIKREINIIVGLFMLIWLLKEDNNFVENMTLKSNIF